MVIECEVLVLGVLNPTNSFVEAACWDFHDLSLELQRSADDDNFIEEVEEVLKIMENNDFYEEDSYKFLDFDHEDEDCAISSTPARNFSTHVTFDDIIELSNYLTEVEFSDSDQEPTLQWQSEYGFSLLSW